MMRRFRRLGRFIAEMEMPEGGGEERSMIYILLDVETANYVATYRTESEALADVRDAVDRLGRGHVADWALAGKSEAGEVTAIAEGDALIERALAAKSTV
jgi:hypothetical protein